MTDELDCKHRFCHECTLSQFKQLIESAQVQKIVCLDYSCQKEIQQESIKRICGDEIALFAKYERFKNKKALEADPLVRWCPKAGCEMHMRATERDVQKLQCPECKTEVCFNCRDIWHGEDQSCEAAMGK